MPGRGECYGLLVEILAGRRQRWLRRFRGQFRGRGRHSLPEEARWDGSRQHRAIAVLLNLQSIEKGFHVGVATRHRDRTLGGVKKLEKCAHLFTQSLGLVLATGE